MSKHKTVESLMLNIQKRMKVVSEEIFMEKVNNISKRISSVMEFSKVIMLNYLKDKAGYGKFPEIRSGNLIHKLIQGNVNTNPVISRSGTTIKATFTGWYGVDTEDVAGISHTVLRTSGKNSPAPYAFYLNKLKRFKTYNGFFNTALTQYNKTLSTQLNKAIDKELGTYRFKIK